MPGICFGNAYKLMILALGGPFLSFPDQLSLFDQLYW